MHVIYDENNPVKHFRRFKIQDGRRVWKDYFVRSTVNSSYLIWYAH